VYDTIEKYLISCEPCKNKSLLPLTDLHDMVPHAHHTDVDVQCDKLVTRPSPIYHTKLTAPERIDVTTLLAAVPQIWLCSPKLKWFTWSNQDPFRDGLPSVG